MHYNRLIPVVVVVNCALLARHFWRGDWHIDDGTALSGLADLIVVNFAIAVLIRQQHVLNRIFALAGRGSRRWPLRLRWMISKVNHIGGLHAEAALAGSLWLLAFAAVAVVARARHPTAVDLLTVVLALGLSMIVVVVVLCALPVMRARAHNLFETTHRFGGWTAVAVFWALTLRLTNGDLATWQVWVLALVTASIVWPWLTLRRVPVTIERPSSHAAIVHLDYGVTPTHAATVGISRSPLREWHAFATVSAPGRSGYRLLISRAGDWTSKFIDDPPSHVWVRGVPVRAPMAEIEVMYRRVVWVVTGSGIGPALGPILKSRVPARLVWSTRNPRATYGDRLVDEVPPHSPMRWSGTRPNAARPTCCAWPMTPAATSRPRQRWSSATSRQPGVWCTAWNAWACPHSDRSGTLELRVTTTARSRDGRFAVRLAPTRPGQR